MDFSPNKTPIEINKEVVFGGTYFWDTYSGVNEEWHKNSWKEFVHLKSIDSKYYTWDCYDVNVNKYGVKTGTSLRFWENKGWKKRLIKYILMVGFSAILGTWDDYSISRIGVMN